MISLPPTSVGSSNDPHYVDASTVGGGVVLPSGVGYQAVVPTLGTLALLGLGNMVATRRRR
ncbi:MAG: hypothetical protein D6692_07335 [Planctomycetota bacterium]|nr:MAG: hypothetical protein D6692_07335 [Planctomycetota bacterium]